MKYCIAIDGGGSKTEIVLFDETGHILRRHVGRAATPRISGLRKPGAACMPA